MKLPYFFIHDSQVFEERKQVVRDIFFINKCLPEQVFNEKFRRFAFEEFDWAMSSEFWPALQALAQASGDTSLLMAALDPEPRSYFKKEFGYYNWANISVSASSNDYWGLVNDHPETSLADSFLANSEKVIWVPHSARWAIWGERNYGVCILAMKECMQVDSWHDAEWALKNCLPNSFKDRIVPADFEAGIRLHFY